MVNLNSITRFIKILGLDKYVTDDTSTAKNVKSFLNISMISFSVTYSLLHLTRPTDMVSFAENLICVTVTLLTSVKIITLAVYSSEIKKLITISERELPTFTRDHPKYVEMCQSAKNKAKVFAWLLFFGMMTTIIGYSFFPLFASRQLKLPLISLGVIITKDSLLAFWINYTYQLWIQFICLLVTTSFDGFFLLFLLKAGSHLDIVLDKLKSVDDENGKIILDKRSRNKSILYELNTLFKDVHQHQVVIIKFIRQLANVYVIQITTQFIMSTALICSTVYNVGKETALFMGIFSFTAIAEIFLICWLGQSLKEKSDLVSTALYLCPWEISDLKNQKTAGLMISCSRKPLIISTGFMDLSLESFTQVIKTAYSFYTLLQNVSVGEERS